MMKKSSSSSSYFAKNKNTFDLVSKPSTQNTLNLKPSKKRMNTSISLNNSYLSQTSKKLNNGVKLPNSYYNDHQKVYLQKSRALSQRSIRYQSKQMSFSQRRKLNQSHIQKVLDKRSQSVQTNKRSKIQFTTFPNKIKIKEKMNKLNQKKYSQLINRGKDIKLEKKILSKVVSEKRYNSNQSRKWSSPFTNTSTFKANFKGKDIVAKKFQGFPTNHNQAQLKVLNLDRLFRKNNGQLTNIIPLPLIKLESAQSRANAINTMKKKDTIHHVIQQFNRLLHINRIKKTKPKIGIRGHNFMRAPTLEELMGIKIHQLKSDYEAQKNSLTQQSQEQIPQQIFIQNHDFYKKHVKKNIHLTRRLLSGIKQEKGFVLGALIRFYAIFINRIASFKQKIKFLLYFFIPHGQQRIQLDVLKLILEIMCEDLPPIGNLSAQKSQFLSKHEKSVIFLEALNKVLFSDLKQFIAEDFSDKNAQKNQNILIDKQILEILLQRNQDAVDLLINLILIQ